MRILTLWSFAIKWQVAHEPMNWIHECHSQRGLESRLGARLQHSIGPHFPGIEEELVALGELRSGTTGTFRILATDHLASIDWRLRAWDIRRR